MSGGVCFLEAGIHGQAKEAPIKEETHQRNENVLFSNCVEQYRIPKPMA